MRLDEIKADPEDFKDWVGWHVEGYKSAQSIKNILRSPLVKKYRKVDGKYIYRAWAISPTRAIQLYGSMAGPGTRFIEDADSITFPTKRPFLSFSWTQSGAEARTWDDDFGSNLRNYVMIITKTELYSPKDVLFNLAQYGREVLQDKADPTIARESEVLIVANEHYLTIAPEEVIKFSPENPYNAF